MKIPSQAQVTEVKAIHFTVAYRADHRDCAGLSR